MAAPALKARLDRATTEHRILEHPFYRSWAAGTLTLDDLSIYSAQYWRQVEAFPGYLASLRDRLDGEAREIVAENLRDEVEGDHPGLWLDFAEGVGAARDAVKGSDVLDETAGCVEAFRSAAAERSLPFALGMLYAYESQTPEVAETKIAGLREHYGIDGPALEYFRLHGELDVEHSDELVNALTQVVTDETAAQEAEAGARAGAEAVWNLLTGISRERGIEMSAN